MPDRMLEDTPDRMPEGMPDRMPDRMSARMPEDMPDKVPECLPDRMPADLPVNMPEDMLDRMPDGMPEDLPDNMPEDMPDRMPDGMPEDMPEHMPEDMPEDMPEHLPEDMPEHLPEDMPGRMPEDMPDRMPDRMPENMSDRMPEDLPVTKCINVMVGITRSKVICFFLIPLPSMSQALLPFSSRIGFILAFQKSPSIMPSTWIVPKRPKAPKNLKTSLFLHICEISPTYIIWWNVSCIYLLICCKHIEHLHPKTSCRQLAGSPTRALLAATWPRALLTFPPQEIEKNWCLGNEGMIHQKNH